MWNSTYAYTFSEQLKSDEEYEECSRPGKEYITNSHYGNCIAVKRHFKEVDYAIEAVYGPGGTIRCIDLVSGEPKDEHPDLRYQFFDGLWFDFPTPFKKGDIVKMVYDNSEEQDPSGFCRGAFVLESLLQWDLDEKRKKKYLEGKSGDTTDMLAYGMFLCEDGRIYNECTDNYMDLEYYRGSYKGVRTILRPLSNYLKGQISLELFLYAYRIMVIEHSVEVYKKEYSWFTDEGLKLAGLLENDGFSHGMEEREGSI